MFLNKSIQIFILCFFIVACASPTKKKFSLNQTQIDKMNQALSFMKNKEFLKGAFIYDELARTLKDDSSNFLILFNAGVAYKEAGQCKKALIRFRKLLDHSLNDLNFKARGLIEISYVYECLGDDELAFLSLKDTEKLLSSLPRILAEVVYPARLAIAHARLEQRPKAEHYRFLSLTKVLQAKKAFSSEKELNEQVSRMFYLMGRSYVKKENIKASAFFKAFSYHQLYLLQSLFLKDKTWSKLAETELNLLFEKLIFSLSNLKNRQKYKKLITQTLEEARVLIKKENSKKLENFYSKKSQAVLKLLSKSS